MNPAENNKQREIIAAVAVLIIIVVIVGFATNNKTKQAVSNTPAAKTNNVQLSTTKAATGSTYKNGIFTATGTYDSPGGTEDFNLTVTIKDDVITDTSATSGSQDTTSREYQNQFISGYKQLVIGKKISDVKLGAVSGSSLTAQGFNDAISKIEREAV